jgi:hypothetical protein
MTNKETTTEEKTFLKEYLNTICKLYGSPLKAFLNIAMVVGVYIIAMVAILASGVVAYGILGDTIRLCVKRCEK